MSTPLRQNPGSATGYIDMKVEMDVRIYMKYVNNDLTLYSQYTKK